MIGYKQLAMGEPPDVEAFTDSRQEMIELERMIGECDFAIQLPDQREPDGQYHFMIPGQDVGDFAELVYNIDGGKLDALISGWNSEGLEDE